MLILLLNISSKNLQNKPFSKTRLYIEEYTFSLIVALWIFYLFKLEVALLLWFVVYLLINLLFLKNAIIKSAYDTDKHYVTQQFKNEILTHKTFWKTKKVVAGSYLKKKGLRPIKLYLKYRTSFGIGLLVAAIMRVLCNFCITGSQSPQNTFDVLLENITLLTAILCCAYKIAYKLSVENVASSWFDKKKWFNIYFALHCVVCYIIVLVISLG